MRQISDRFAAALRHCVSGKPLKERLADAWINELEDIGISELPEQLRAEFRRLRESMHTAVPQPNEPVARASIRKMSAEQAERETCRILQLARELQHISVQAESLVADTGPDELVFTASPPQQRLN